MKLDFKKIFNSSWRLQVARPHSTDQILDLRHHAAVFVGDESDNDVCIHTTQIPGHLKMVHKLFTYSQKPTLRLTDEVIPTLQGEFRRKKNWITKLYSGAEFEVQGECQWQVGEAHFSLMPIMAAGLSTDVLATPEDETLRPWMRAFSYAGGAHAAIFALLLMIGLTQQFFFKKEDALEVIAKISLSDAQKVFVKPKAATPEQVQEAKNNQDIEIPKVDDNSQEQISMGRQMKADINQDRRKMPSQRLVAKLVPMAGAKAAAPVKAPEPRSMANVGLLAIQSTKSATAGSVSIATAAIQKASSSVSKAPIQVASLQMGSADYGLGTGANAPQIARIGSLSGTSYKGGELSGVGSGSGKKGPAIQLVRKEIEVRGALDPAVIRQIIEERLSEIRYCYETALLKNDKLSGKIATSWTIKSDGSVGELLSASDEIKGDTLHPCVRAQIQKWKFPEPKGGGVVRVKYPFVFNPVGGT